MNISEQWLREWVNPELDFMAIGEKLTVAGLEVDAVEKAATDFTGIVVGEILSVEKHPDADKLNVCQVNNGDETLQIVCGASNVRAGMKAPLALMGAVLPMPEGKPLKIKKGKLRGVASHGMLCAATELGMAESSDGLLDLPSDAPVGQDIREYLKLDDTTLELAITPNRGDALSVMGVAREVSLLTGAPLATPAIPTHDVQHDDTLQVALESDVCPRYAGRIIRNINPQATTPLWMQEKLRRAGLRSLSPLVDVTNYVLLELGQPMHAFDLDKLQGDIVVRQAKSGESLELLDGQTVELRDDTLVIADSQNPVALAGIMGGNPTAVTDATQHVFLESAHFRPEKMMGKARSYGLHTDSSYRFERGVAADLPQMALERATQLILEICGGEVGAITDVCSDESVLTRRTVTLREARIQRILGIEMSRDDVEGALQRLDCEIETTDSGWQVQPPLARFDISIEEDLVEELARVHGYDAIPAVSRPLMPQLSVPSETQTRMSNLRAALVMRGYQEAVTFSFIDPEIEEMLSPTADEITLANPISQDLSRMRTTLWSGLLRAVSYNLNRQQGRVRLFETGPAFYLDDDGEPKQRRKISGVITGLSQPEQWAGDKRKVDFYDVKGDVEALLDQISGLETHYAPVAHSALHPGQSAQIMTRDEVIGWVGALHPRIEMKLGLDQRVFLFEIDLDALLTRSLPTYQAVSKFPAIRRDLALVVDDSVLALALENAIKKVAPPSLIKWNIFDVYTGEGLESGKKSIALSLILQDYSRTLEDAEVNQIVDDVVASLQNETGAVLR